MCHSGKGMVFNVQLCRFSSSPIWGPGTECTLSDLVACVIIHSPKINYFVVIVLEVSDSWDSMGKYKEMSNNMKTKPSKILTQGKIHYSICRGYEVLYICYIPSHLT